MATDQETLKVKVDTSEAMRDLRALERLVKSIKRELGILGKKAKAGAK